MANNAPLPANVSAIRLTDAEIRKVFLEADRDIGNILATLPKNPKIGAQVRSAQLRIRRNLIRAWKKSGDLTAEGIANASKAATKTYTARDRALFRRLGLNADEYLKQLAAEANNSIKTLQAKKTNGISLSERVYKNGLVSSGKVTDLINRSIVEGKSAAEIAKDVKGMINPRTPGGVRYAAQRLARTELNNAFHETARQRYKENEFVDFVLWNLSGSHPKPDECNAYAEQQHEKGQEGGVYSADNTPNRPHPNCLCYITAVEMDEAEFMRNVKSGRYDDLPVDTPTPR